MNITIVGLGKLGAPIAAAIASRGHDVIGIDKNRKVVDKINAGISPVDEPHMKQMMSAVKGSFSASTDLKQGVHGADVIGVLVPTPSLKNGKFSHEYVLDVCKRIGKAIRGTVPYGDSRIISVMSTLMPGTMEEVIKPAIEQASGYACGDSWELAYNPELVAIGSVIEDYLNPNLVIVGQSGQQAGVGLVGFILSTMLVEPHQIHQMSLTNAEIVKMGINMFVSSKIAFANLLGDICERFPGGDIDLVSAAVGSDSRVGKKYFIAGMPYGGTCFPRDVRAFEEIVEDLCIPGNFPWAVSRSNKARWRRLVDIATGCLSEKGTVAILGLSYKSGTPCMIGSPSIELARRMAAKDVRVVGYDERMRQMSLPEFIEPWSLGACLKKADVIIIANRTEQFAQISQSDFEQRQKQGTVVDCWRILRGKIQNSKKIKMRYIGVSEQR
ncbi:hypothetical protein LCGC14_0275330 [marine sediment metagenome]|uniref:UDP-glucose 6-dehydrogenase n=1 Tax=marine sediment metagenome TaxID=412755 RepID=A0A0F9X2N4_9ZZZZ